MKTLRLLRNIAALFILVAPLLGPRPAAAGGDFCGQKRGFDGCFPQKQGNCKDTKCKPGSPCLNLGCVVFQAKGF